MKQKPSNGLCRLWLMWLSLSYFRQLLQQLLVTIDRLTFLSRSWQFDHRLLLPVLLFLKHSVCGGDKAATKHHSPSQGSEVQLNTPPWQTLEEEEGEWGKLYAGQNSDENMTEQRDTEHPTCHTAKAIRLYLMGIKTTARKMRILTTCLLQARHYYSR